MRLINFTIFRAMIRDDSGPLLSLLFVISESFCVLKMINTVTVVQVSVLTDQVEVQGEKIRDLENCLEHHREKLNATEQLLQQVVFLFLLFESDMVMQRFSSYPSCYECYVVEKEVLCVKDCK